MEKLEGELVRLRPPKEEDWPYLADMKNDLKTQGWNQRLPPTFTPEMLEEKNKKGKERKNSANLAIETHDGELIGTISYSEEPARLAASFGITTGKEHWGKGYAKEAQEILLHFLFIERGLHVVRLWTQTGFPWAEKAATKLGFKIACRFREDSIIGGKYVDCLCMDMIREEYFELRGLDDPLPPRNIQ